MGGEREKSVQENPKLYPSFQADEVVIWKGFIESYKMGTAVRGYKGDKMEKSKQHAGSSSRPKTLYSNTKSDASHQTVWEYY